MTPDAIEIERKLKRDCVAVDVFVSDDPSGFIVCGFINGLRVIRLQAATVKGAIGKFSIAYWRAEQAGLLKQ